MEPNDVDARELAVEVAAVRWRAPDSDFAVVVGITEEGEEVVAVGALGHVHEGEEVELAGAWQEHARHGWRFAARQARLRPPSSADALLAYIGSIKHVGPRGARWLLDHHGPGEVLAAIDRDPEGALRGVPGIGRARIGPAVHAWEEQGAQRAVRLLLEEHGVPGAVAARVYRTFGPQTMQLLRTDPYQLTDVEGIGFTTADALAQALGTAHDDPGRLDAGVRHALREAERDGHCHLPRAELEHRAARLLGEDASQRVDALATAGRIVVDGDRVLHPAMARAEGNLARRVRELLEDDPTLRVGEVERPTGRLAPSDDQWSVVETVLARRLAILTGGPGTGKTQTMRALVDLLREHKRTVRLCAPTGKAARRLSETTGAPATTIHRLLEYQPNPSPPTHGFARDADDPIPGTDLLVVDEASMLDVRLAQALFAAVGSKTHVLLVGDPDQLASVGPGRVLDDLLDSGAVPTVRLTEIFRQAARSLIVRAAHAIDAGEPPPTEAGPEDVRDFFLVTRAGADAIREEVVALAGGRLAGHLGVDARSGVLVLAPMHRGPAGIDVLNDRLRALLNPDGTGIGGTGLRVGDRVIQTVNDHEHELMNGELGVLEHHDRDRDRVLLACDDGRRLTLPARVLGTLRLAHAISIHKAQGSQAPGIVVVLHRGHSHMLTRNLLYTAVTRAERACVVVGEPAALHAALSRRDSHARHTRLRELVAPG